LAPVTGIAAVSRIKAFTVSSDGTTADTPVAVPVCRFVAATAAHIEAGGSLRTTSRPKLILLLLLPLLLSSS